VRQSRGRTVGHRSLQSGHTLQAQSDLNEGIADRLTFQTLTLVTTAMRITSFPLEREAGLLPAISVVIPARNAQQTLAETLSSVLTQDFADWELIVVDDGSTDGTLQIAQKVALQDRRVRCVQGPGRGVSAARNLGASLAQAQLIAFLDADDLWQPGKLSAHWHHFAKSAQLGVSFDRIAFVDEHGKATGVESTRRVHELAPHDFLYENPACTASTLVMRRAAMVAGGLFDESMRFAEDLEFLVRLRCTTPWQVEGLDAVLTHYRANPAGASASLTAMQQGWETLVEKVHRYAPDLVAAHGRGARAIHLRYLARRAVRLKLPARQGLEFFARAAACHPVVLLREPRRSLGTLAALLALAVVQNVSLRQVV
jgi:glycosyltransferase involved in cell wall biosynthesis